MNQTVETFLAEPKNLEDRNSKLRFKWPNESQFTISNQL